MLKVDLSQTRCCSPQMFRDLSLSQFGIATFHTPYRGCPSPAAFIYVLQSHGVGQLIRFNPGQAKLKRCRQCPITEANGIVMQVKRWAQEGQIAAYTGFF